MRHEMLPSLSPHTAHAQTPCNVATGPTPDAWNGAMGLAATTLSEQELFDLYGFEMEFSSSSLTEGDNTSTTSASTSPRAFNFCFSALSMLPVTLSLVLAHM